MRTGRVPLAGLLLVLASTVLQVSSTNDIYWEGEEDASNEFLEVKQKDTTVLDSLKRLKRDWGFLNFFDTPKEPEAEAETATETVPDDNGSYGKDDDVDVGSGAPDKSVSEPREKTLRVTFLVMEPYITAYSNRDSPEFLNISRSLANAVDLLFESLPGTQRSSLVRIQSLVNDDFLCKVTLDIVTTRNEDTDTIKDILRNHIKNIGRLGETSVRDGDFSAQLIDPGTTFDCDFYEFKCDGNLCLPLSAKCNGQPECRDGSDEYDCPPPPTSEATVTETTTVDDYDNNIDDKDSNQNPYEVTSDYPYTEIATPETPNSYAPAGPYNQNPEVPYEQGPDNGYSDNTNVGPDNRDPYGQNTDQDNRDPYGQKTDQDNRDPYGQNTDQDNRDPYGQTTPPDNRSPYGLSGNPNTGILNPDNRTPGGSTSETPSSGYEQETGSFPRGDIGSTGDYTTDTPDIYTETETATSAATAAPGGSSYDCPASHLRCDETRCVELTRRCDGIRDCFDGTDEAGCPSQILYKL